MRVTRSGNFANSAEARARSATGSRYWVLPGRRDSHEGEEVGFHSARGVVRSGLKLGIAAVIVILLAPFAANLSHVFGALPNLFGSERHERVQPPVLKSLQDLSDYHAATRELAGRGRGVTRRQLRAVVHPRRRREVPRGWLG